MLWVGQQQTFGSQKLCSVGQQAWVCWILLTVGQIRFCGIVLFFFMYFGCLLFGGIVIGMPNAPISDLAWAAGGISGVDFFVVVPLTLPL